MSDMWDRLSEQARVVMRLALAESEQLGHGYVGDEHVLLGLLRDQANPASSLLRGHGLDLASARAELQRLAELSRGQRDQRRAGRGGDWRCARQIIRLRLRSTTL